ncbi:MAG: response regulator transcription factor [Anaerostipes sp.]|jgi:two-component system response regulator protein BraR/BceR|nr:response regulator transcription factor [Anaerostipes sp.]
MYRILIVEDDMMIAREMQKQIKVWGFETKVVENFQNILIEFAAYEPQLVLLDISLPFFNGYHWCSEIRKVSKIPIIFISSMSDNMNIVMAMNMGGDDFISKPFDFNVLMAKIQALLRRTYDFGNQMSLMEHKGVMLNLSDGSVLYEGKQVDLSKNEYKILQSLMEQVGTIVSREDIMERLWESESFVDDNTLTVNVTRLRKKLENAGIKDYIKTKKGIGYWIEG